VIKIATKNRFNILFIVISKLIVIKR